MCHCRTPSSKSWVRRREIASGRTRSSAIAGPNPAALAEHTAEIRKPQMVFSSAVSLSHIVSGEGVVPEEDR